LTTRYKLLIADDHLLFLDSLSMLLETLDEVELVGAVGSGHEVLRLLQTKPVDVLLCDYAMPEMDGVALTLKIRAQYPQVAVIMLTGKDDADGIRQAVAAGVQGFLSKNVRKEELRRAIKSVGEGLTYFSPHVMQLLSHIGGDDGAPPLAALTKREVEILHHIAQGLTGVQIAEALHISTNTVETHRKNLFSKLRVNSTFSLIKYALEHHI
jgi:two-component system, NarL family, nitrate/nitrite response regulator NarL